MKNIFDTTVITELIERINKLTPATLPIWGKMNAAQMLAHCNVAYELVYDNKHPKPNFIQKIFINLFAKETVTGSKPYKKNQPTGPAFYIKGERDFSTEKNRLINHIKKTAELGEAYFDSKESHSFGKLSLTQWNTMFYKHLEHHLTQFGV
ncbi:MAG: DUF1569 domain-containing protein [Flavitalea sp.]